MENRAKILVVEDEPVISNFLLALLESSGYQPLLASCGNEAISMTVSYIPDLILLDLGLPDIDGIDVLGRIREWSSIPILVLSAREKEHEKVQALDSGANDYITKPFGNKELLARIRTALRQYGMLKAGGVRAKEVFSAGSLSVDYARRKVTAAGKSVHLTPIEYRILVLLTHNAGKVLTHDYILREIWGPYAGDSQILRVNMANIRRKIELNPADPHYILTEVGVGYRFSDYDIGN